MSKIVRSAGSIRSRLLAWLVVPATVILLLGTLVDYVARQRPVRDAYDQALLDSAVAIAANVRPSGAQGLALALPAAAERILRTDSADQVFYRVTRADGRYVAGDQDLPQLGAAASNPFFGGASYHGEEIRLVSLRTTTPEGAVTTVVGETMNKRHRVQTRLWYLALSIDLLELVAILAIVWVGVNVALRPLQVLRSQIASRKARDLEPLDSGKVPAEVRRVVDELNRLFEAIVSSNHSQRLFLDNAAHQLRTPLAGVESQLEIVLTDTSEARTHERVSMALGATRRLSRTTRQLLTMARAEHTLFSERDFAPMDLPRLAEACISDHYDAALSAGIDMGAELAPVVAPGIPWLMSEALNNLIDNAIKYTPSGGRITVRCGFRGRAAFIQVEDTGIGIPVTERERVMQRFVRGQNATGMGSGLGLAIVSDVASVFGADLLIGNGSQGLGTSITFRFAAT